MKNLELKDFLEYKYLSNVELSPNKQHLAYLVHKAEYEKNKYKARLYVYNISKKSNEKLASLNEEKSFVWLNDSKILFSNMRDKDMKKKVEEGENWTSYYAIDIKDSEAKEYMQIPLVVTDIKVITEDQFVLTGLYQKDEIQLSGLEGKEREHAIQRIEDHKDYEILDEIPFWFNGKGFTNKKRNRLYLFNRKTKELQAITDETTDVETMEISGDKIIFTAKNFIDKKSSTSSLSIFHMEHNTCEELIAEGKYAISYGNIIEGTVVFIGSSMSQYGVNENANFYTVSNGEVKLLWEHDFGLGNTVGSDCRLGGGADIRVEGKYLYFISTESKYSFVKKLSLEGEITTMTLPKGSVDCFDIGNDEVFFIGLREDQLQELYRHKEEEKQITTLNTGIIKTRKRSQPESFYFESQGITIEGFVIKPVDFDENKKYPAIVDIHGGPKTVYGSIFFHEMQVWANKGYFVLFCNPRGSDGRGNEFADIRGKYGTIDYEDLMKFTDLALETYPQIDGQRLGVTGGSYGGFMTNWMIGHTNRFKCAASQRSISNWVSMGMTSDIGYEFDEDQMASTPWDQIEKQWWHSPLKYANQVTTPTLFIHAEQDYRCWLPEGLQMFTALKYHGVESRLCMFRGENHELSRSGKPKHRVKRLEEITNWFEQHLK